MSVRVALALTLALAACGGGRAPAAPAPTPTVAPSEAPPPADPVPPAPPSPKDLLPAHVEQVVHGYETIASAAGPAASCGAIADAIIDVARANAVDRAVVTAASRGELAADVDALMVAAEPRLGPALATIEAAAARCAAEPRVAHALERLERRPEEL